jgi:type IV pilus assembly protein PilB
MAALGRIQTTVVNQLKMMGLLNAEQHQEVLDSPTDLNGEALDKLLYDLYGLSTFKILVAKAKAAGLPAINIARCKQQDELFERVPREFCREHKLMPVSVVGDLISVAFSNPFALNVSARIEEMTGLRVVSLLALESEILHKLKSEETHESLEFGDVVDALGEEFADVTGGGLKEEDLEDEDSKPIIQLANRIIEDAFKSGASDIHVEPWEKEVIVRYRIDGVCQEKLRLPAKVNAALVARLKIMSNLDIAERRIPQDGRIIYKQFTKKKINIDLRVSTAPLNYGEGVVMRILDKEKSTLPLPLLGFSEENLARYREVIVQPYGMILHCGPTGSGKSMTLYSALNEISSPETVIRTAEDPIEYTLAGINQMQMNRQIGLTFAAALRAFLRQDPDIILVGEIRDKETANIAVEAALTGHLLLSTLHTNDAPGTIARLTDMGIEPFMISSSLLCVCSQRLMRRVCKKCRIPYEPEGREAKIMEKAIGWTGTIYKANPKGCTVCGGSGYKGRVGIHELMTASEELVQGINQELETSELKKIAMRNGMKTLHQDSMLKVKEGTTTIEEAISTVPPDM